MKKIYFLSLFLSLATLAFSQQKNEFGFVVKAGNYAIPSEKKEYQPFNNGGNSWTTSAQKAGETYTFGLWYARRLSGHVRLSAELLYRRASVLNKQGSYYDYFDGIQIQRSEYLQTQHINENSLSLPIKLHFSFKKEGRTTFALGGGFSRVFAAEVGGQNESQYGFDEKRAYQFPQMPSRWEDFDTQLNLTAGLSHRLDTKTSIGLEYSFERSSERGYSVSPSNLSLIDCLCYGYYLLPSRNMNSFSLSLRHNILD